MMKTISNIVSDLNIYGYHIANIVDLGLDRVFKKNSLFMEDLVTQRHVKDRAKRLISGNPIRDRKKFYEMQNKQLLGKALELDDGCIIESYLQDAFLDVAQEYLETSDPKLRNCLALYHPQNPYAPMASQKWHRDQEDFKILKIFIYYNEVRKDNGSLWYVKGSAHGGKNNHIWPNMHGGSANLDAAATSKIPPEDIVALEGVAGTVCFFNSNGFHRGGHVKSGERLATHACYLSPSAPHIKNGVLPSFDYNPEEINVVNKDSEKYKLLTERQKRVIE